MTSFEIAIMALFYIAGFFLTYCLSYWKSRTSRLSRTDSIMWSVFLSLVWVFVLPLILIHYFCTAAMEFFVWIAKELDKKLSEQGHDLR